MRAISKTLMLFFFAVLISAASAAPTSARDLPIYGGPGGNYFRSDCGGDYVAGIYVRSGLWVDAIGLKCATYDRRRQTFRRPAWNRPYHGGRGGRLQEVVCPADRYVTAIKHGYTRQGSRERFLDYVEITCTPVGYGGVTRMCLHSGDGCWYAHPSRPGFGVYTAAPHEQGCSSRESARGLHGRSGNFVDAIGLICGPGPR